MRKLAKYRMGIEKGKKVHSFLTRCYENRAENITTFFYFLCVLSPFSKPIKVEFYIMRKGWTWTKWRTWKQKTNNITKVQMMMAIKKEQIYAHKKIFSSTRGTWILIIFQILSLVWHIVSPRSEINTILRWTVSRNMMTDEWKRDKGFVPCDEADNWAGNEFDSKENISMIT